MRWQTLLHTAKRHATFGWTLLLVAAFAFMAWALSSTYAAREVRFRHQVEVGLNAVNQLQISAIAAWRAHKRAEAEMLSDDDVLTTAVMQWLQQRDSAHETLLRTRLRSLVERLQYRGAYLVDTRGRLLLDAHGATGGRLPATESTALEQAFVQAGPAIVGLRQGDGFDSTFFSMLAPLFDARGEAVAAIWLVMDAGTTLYPLLQGWPTTSHSGESLLLQQDERGLLYASPMRERADAPLTRYMGTSPSRDTIADRLTHGVRGVFYARDDQHHWVVATAGIVPDSHWLVVSKMDTAEAFAEVQQRNWQVLALAASLALLLSGSLVLLWLRHAWQRERTLKRDLQEHMMWLDAAQKAASVGYYVYDIQSQTYRGSTMAFEIFGLQPAPPAPRASSGSPRSTRAIATVSGSKTARPSWSTSLCACSIASPARTTASCAGSKCWGTILRMPKRTSGASSARSRTSPSANAPRKRWIATARRWRRRCASIRSPRSPTGWRWTKR